MFMEQPITAEEITRAYGQIKWHRTTASRIIDEVCDRSGITLAEITGPNRSRQYAYPRQYAMWKIRQNTDYSYAQIGRMFGNRDHTTVIHACRAVEGRMVKEGRL